MSQDDQISIADYVTKGVPLRITKRVVHALDEYRPEHVMRVLSVIAEIQAEIEAEIEESEVLRERDEWFKEFAHHG